MEGARGLQGGRWWLEGERNGEGSGTYFVRSLLHL